MRKVLPTEAAFHYDDRVAGSAPDGKGPAPAEICLARGGLPESDF
jgi:hypothetical protein